MRSTLVIWNLQTKFKGNVLEDINIYMSSVVFDMFLHINCHYIKNCIHYCAIQFMICSLYNNVQVIFEFKVFFFCFTVRVLECQLLWHWYDFFFHCHEMILKRSETVDLYIILSNFRMFWNSFCSKVRKGVGVEPILTKKLASLP